MDVLKSIKAFFIKKDNNEETEEFPQGVCPNCWGYNEWEDEYYKVIKYKHLKPGIDIYNNFIQKVADKHIATSHVHENKYVCITCDKEIV